MEDGDRRKCREGNSMRKADFNESTDEGTSGSLSLLVRVTAEGICSISR